MNEKILFASDLDNTLLVSHRCRQDSDICVELNQGKEQSFMTKRAIGLLREINRQIGFVPITTRSLEQYRRIEWPEGCEPEMAVVANGAILLRRNEIDGKWSNQIKPVVDAVFYELKSQYERHLSLKDYISCRIVDDSYVFLYCDEEADVAACVDECRRHTTLKVEHLGRKIYFFPAGLGKGEALIRLKECLRSSYIYAAGDSPIDVSMLRIADMAFAENGLREEVGTNCQVQPEGVCFSEWLLEKILEHLNSSALSF